MSSVQTISSVIGTAGHVDHGKTSLIKALTGIDTERKEEKRRGLTIDLGFAHIDFKTPGGTVRAGLVDVPGHERFLKNMLAGITGVDTVLFAVAATDGVMPQTLEHFHIIRLLGTERAIFVVTKKDLAAPGRVEEVESDIRRLVEGTRFEGSPVTAVSTLTGEGMEELKSLIWRTIEGRGESGGRVKGFFRLPVDRVFSIKGFGTVVTGTVISGSVRQGDDLLSFPGGKACKVKGMESLHTTVEEAGSGQRAALNITGLSRGEIERGSVLCSPGLSDFVSQNTGKADCFFDFLPGERTFKGGNILKLHHLTGEALVRIQFAGRREVATGEEGVFGRVFFKSPLLMLKGDRFILRDFSRNETVGGGEVHLPYLSRELTPGLSGMEIPRRGEGIADTLKKILPRRGVGFCAKTVTLMLNAKEEDLPGKGDFSLRDGFVLEKGRLGDLRKRVSEVISGYHSANPAVAGIREEEVIKTVKGEFSLGLEGRFPELFKSLIDGMAGSGEVKRDKGVLSLSSFSPALRGADARVGKELKKIFSGARSVTSEEIKNLLPGDFREARTVLDFMKRKGEVVRIKEGSFISGEFADTARRKFLDLVSGGGSVKASEFRDALGCGRKLAIEILEYFDSVRLSLRQGDARVLHPGASDQGFAARKPQPGCGAKDSKK